MSTGRRKSEGGAPSRNPTRGKKKKEEGNQLLVGLMIGGGVVAVAGIVFFLTQGGTPASAPAPSVAAAPAAVPAGPPAAHAAVPPTSSATPTPIAAAPSAVPAVATVPAQPSPAQPSPMPLTSATIPIVDASIQKNVATATPTGPMANLIPKGSADPGKEYTMPELIERIDPGVVRLSSKKGRGESTGSGFLIDDQGTVVTNYHVICGSKDIQAEFENGDKTPVEGFYAVDQKRDIAILRIAKPAAIHTPIRLAKELPKKGTSVVAFGCPHGLAFSTTQGIVSGIRKPEFVKERLGNTGTMIQTDTPISPGNSGGPLVNMAGEVVAMNTMVMTIGQNLNFSVSSLDIAEVLTKKAASVTPITPETAPDEDQFEEMVARFDDLSATERGRHILGQIDEVVLAALPFPLDPTDRINSYCVNHLEKAVESKLKLKRRTNRSLPGFAPLVMCAFNWTLPKDPIRNGDLASNLELRMLVISRDVDKDGNEVVAVVYKDTSVVGTLSLGALAEGKITKAMETNVPKFFDKFVNAVRKAKREAQTGSSK